MIDEPTDAELFSGIYPGHDVSTSNNACCLSFSGGGPYDGKAGLFDHDEHSSIGIVLGGVFYEYRKSGPRRYSLKLKGTAGD